jgi:hypothetical protein
MLNIRDTDTNEVVDLGDPTRVLTRFREYILGPMRFMNLLSCFELGIIDLLRKNSNTRMTARQIGDATGITTEAVEQMLHLMVKEDFVSYDEISASYALDELTHLSDEDFGRVIPWMNMIKVICLRQLYYLSDSVKSGKVVGLKEFYDFDGILYEACSKHDDLRAAWGAMMDQVTAFIDPWFFENVDIPDNTKILDLAGNTGLGAILAYRFKRTENLHVTCFDFPEKKGEALRNFRLQGVQDHCSFIGGDVFTGVPKGFDIVMIKHFLDMFDEENVFRILRAVNEALEVGGQVYVLVPIYPEDLKSSCSVDFFPAYFLGCTMGQGGPQKLSTYEKWMESCGFKITKTIAQDIRTMPPDMIPVHGILCATKTSS